MEQMLKELETTRKLADGQLIGLIADERTCVGFLLAGIGECNEHGRMNFLTVDENVKDSTIEQFFQEMCNRGDIAVLLIDKDIARRISQTIRCWQESFPIIVEIPSKDQICSVQSEGELTQTLTRQEDSSFA